MKRLLPWPIVCLIIVILGYFLPSSIFGQQSGNLNVTTAVISKNIVDRQPMEPGSRFSVSDERLYCYSKITNIENSTQIFHVWYFGDTERARVALNISPPSWRTYSSKRIQAHETGNWHVKILDAAENLLDKIEFSVTP